MKKIITLLVLTLTTLFSFTAMAWWGTGHELVGLVAEQNLTPQAKKACDALLAKQIVYPGNKHIADCTKNYADANTWCDDIKGTEWVNEKNNDISSMFHYINPKIYPDKTYTKKDINKAVSELLTSGTDLAKYNCYTALLSSIKTLKDSSCSEAEKAVAFRFLLHTVGDIHMPFHNTAPIILGVNTLGGNGIKFAKPFTAAVIPPPDGKTTAMRNMHALWDAGGGFCDQLPYIPEVAPVTEAQAAYLDKTASSIIASESKAKHVVNKVQDPKIRHWIIESAYIAANAIQPQYITFTKDQNEPEKNVIGTVKNRTEYQDAVKEHSIAQIYIGGIRQAKLINAIFDPEHADKSYVQNVEKIAKEKNVPTLSKLFPEPITFKLAQ